MIGFHPYLVLPGTCREAFTRYREVFGGELTLLTMAEAPGDERPPPEHAELIMHAALTVGDGVLMGSDDPAGGGPMAGCAVSFATGDAAQAARVFEGLSDGGTVTMPLGETFWSPCFGMCTDRFGVSWMVNTEAPTEGA
jgi:PhnB protein